MGQDFHSIVVSGQLATMTVGELRVYIALCDRATPHGLAVASVRDLADVTGLHRRNVRRAVSRLEEKALLALEERKGRSTVYTLLSGRDLAEGEGASAPGEESTRGASAPGEELTPGASTPPGRAPAPPPSPSCYVVVGPEEKEQQQEGMVSTTLLWNIPPGQLEVWEAKYGLERLVDAIEVVKGSREPRNPGGLLRRAVERGWRPATKRSSGRKTEKTSQTVSLRCRTCQGVTVAVDPIFKDGTATNYRCTEPTRPPGKGDLLWGECHGLLEPERAASR